MHFRRKHESTLGQSDLLAPAPARLAQIAQGGGVMETDEQMVLRIAKEWALNSNRWRLSYPKLVNLATCYLELRTRAKAVIEFPVNTPGYDEAVDALRRVLEE